MNTLSLRKRGVAIALAILMLQLVLSGCSSLVPQEAHRVLHLEQPINSTYQPFSTIELCLDSPPLYPVRLAHEAAVALADRIGSAVSTNFGGLLVFVSFITSQSFQNSAMQFSVPAFPVDPSAPAKPKLGDDPYANASSQSDYQKAFAAWQAQLILQHRKLAELRKQVKGYTDKLRALVPPYDNKGADQFGCLQNATADFKGISGDKYLLIASPLENTTWLQESNSIALSGVTVKVIYHTCPQDVASVCQSSDANWKKLLLHFGAKSVTFFDVPQSEVEKPSF